MKEDANAPKIVAELRAQGCSVVYIKPRPGAGTAGLPDLLVGRNGRTYLLEVKVPGGTLSKAQVKWIGAWNGVPVKVVYSVEDAFEAVELWRDVGSPEMPC